jgi:hypothetical protein
MAQTPTYDSPYPLRLYKAHGVQNLWRRRRDRESVAPHGKWKKRRPDIDINQDICFSCGYY